MACAFGNLIGVPPVPPRGSGDESSPAGLSAIRPGDRIGPYKILEEIGRGGYGSVYVAQQEAPVSRRVAIKVINLGMDTREVIGRFEAERQALAMMDHPNIAKVLDAGSSETGRPYFVMELVKGVPITEYCDRNHLTTEQRLRLFVQVCHAVQHAHQKGIIHRDLKPPNILVALQDGQAVPKVIDFGIAKAMHSQRLTDKTVHTAVGEFMGTPEYMSPEQADLSGLDIDTRTDIYALGVLLYELLTGFTPFGSPRLRKAGYDEIRRIIRDEEPLRPSHRIGTLHAPEQSRLARDRRADLSKLVGVIRGELDWIVMKALEKDRARRYETANGLAADVLRHLDNEPVLARPPGRLYRFRKMVRRNRAAVAGTAAVFVALLIGLGLSTRFFLSERVARREQTRLRQDAQAARIQAEQESRQAKSHLAAAQIGEAAALLQNKTPHFALAKLAAVLRADPQDSVAANWITQLLMRRLWAVPEEIRATPLRLDDHPGWLWELFTMGVHPSPDGRFLLRFSSVPKTTYTVTEVATGKVLAGPETAPAEPFEADDSPDPTFASSFSFSADSRWLVVGARLFDLRIGVSHSLAMSTNPPPQLHRGYRGRARTPTVRFSTDSSAFLFRDPHQGIAVWRLENRTNPAPVWKSSGWFDFADLSWDGTTVVMVRDARVEWVDLATGKVTRTRTVPRENQDIGAWQVVRASEDLTHLLLWRGDSPGIALWPAAADVSPAPLQGAHGQVVRAEVRPELGVVALLAGEDVDDLEAALYSLAGLRLNKPIPSAPGWSSRFLNEGGHWGACPRIYSTGVPGIRLYHALAGESDELTLWDPEGAVGHTFLPDGTSRTFNRAGRITRWSFPHGGANASPLFATRLATDLQMVAALVIAPESRAFEQYSPRSGVFTIGVDQSTLVFQVDPRPGRRPNFSFDSEKPLAAVSLSSNGDKVAAGDTAGRIEIRLTSDGSVLAETVATNPATRLTFDSGGGHLAAVDDLGQLMVYELRGTNEPLRLEVPAGEASRALFNPEDGTLLVLHSDRRLSIWALAGRRRLGEATLPSPPTCAKFANRETLVVGCSQGQVVQFHWDGRQVVETGAQDIGGTVLSLDSNEHSLRFLVLAAGDRTAIWDLDSKHWRTIAREPRVAGTTESISFGSRFGRLSPDGRWIVSSGRSGGIDLLDAETGRPLCETFSEGVEFWDGSLDSARGRLIGIQRDRRVRVWELPGMGAPAPGWWGEFAEQVAGCRYDSQVGLVDVPRRMRSELVSWVERQPDSVHRQVARWFLGNRRETPVSPGATNTYKERIREQVSNGWPAGGIWDALRSSVPERELISGLRSQWDLKRDEDLSVREVSILIQMAALTTVWASEYPEFWLTRLSLLDDTEDLGERLWVATRMAERFPTNGAVRWAVGKAFYHESRSAEAISNLAAAVRFCSGESLTNALRLQKNARIEQLDAWRDEGQFEAANAELLAWGVPRRDPATPEHLLDLSRYYNAALTEDWHNFSDVGNNLGQLPTGVQTIQGVPWDIRGVVQLEGNGLSLTQPGYPQFIRGIRVARRSAKIHFLYGTGWVEKDGQTIGSLDVNLGDQRRVPIKLVYGENVRNWQFWPEGEAKEHGGAPPAWKGPQARWKDSWPGTGVRLYCLTWTNPDPGMEVESIDFSSTMSNSAPFLIAITVEP